MRLLILDALDMVQEHAREVSDLRIRLVLTLVTLTGTDSGAMKRSSGVDHVAPGTAALA